MHNNYPRMSGLKSFEMEHYPYKNIRMMQWWSREISINISYVDFFPGNDITL